MNFIPQQHSEHLRLWNSVCWSRHKEHGQTGCFSKGLIVWRTALVMAGCYGLKCRRISASLNQRILLQILACSRCHGVSTKPACPFITWPALCCDSGSGSRCEIDLSVGAWSCWCNGLRSAAAILWPSAEWQSSAERRKPAVYVTTVVPAPLGDAALFVSSNQTLLSLLSIFVSLPPFSSPPFHMQACYTRSCNKACTSVLRYLDAVWYSKYHSSPEITLLHFFST